MADKERLEKIKESVNYKEWFEGYHLDATDIHWLIIQANLTQKFEEELKRHREVLEFYASRANYRGYPTAGGWVKTPINDDGGKKARQVLGWEEE